MFVTQHQKKRTEQNFDKSKICFLIENDNQLETAVGLLKQKNENLCDFPDSLLRTNLKCYLQFYKGTWFIDEKPENIKELPLPKLKGSKISEKTITLFW